MNPRISIIMPIYNRVEMLERALASVVVQTISDWELIMVDDGSNEEIWPILEEYNCKDYRFRLLHRGHLGISEARNAGLLVARGDYITFLDSDDEYDLHHLEFRMHRMQSKDHPDLLFGGIRVIGDDMITDKNDHSRKISAYDAIITGMLFGKREVFQNLGGFRDLNYAEDADFFDRAKQLYHVARVSEPSYLYYRDHPDQVTNSV
jgi:glycosyltransferase involved in cell wall biosynthesis